MIQLNLQNICLNFKINFDLKQKAMQPAMYFFPSLSQNMVFVEEEEDEGMPQVEVDG